MIFMYEGYQFLRNKKVWTCVRWYEPVVGTREPSWLCQSDDGEQGKFPLSELSLYPQVISTPGWEPDPTDPGAGHPGEPGTRGRYTKGCRCDQCRAANAAYMKRRRRGV